MPHSDVPQKNTNLGQPSDPTSNLQTFTGGVTYGFTGVTAQSDDQDQILDDALKTDAESEDGTNLLSIKSPTVMRKAAHMRASSDDDIDDPDDLLLEGMDDSSNDTIYDGASPSILGEQSVSGDMTDPESDDDMLLNSHQVGLRLDEDEDNPQELNIAADVAAAERSRRGLDQSGVEDDDDEF